VFGSANSGDISSIHELTRAAVPAIRVGPLTLVQESLSKGCCVFVVGASGSSLCSWTARLFAVLDRRLNAQQRNES